MPKTKASSKKQRQKQQQKRGVDFKKIKRKLGRKLPPPKNATDTEIKSKAIVLPEQSVASEKAGLAVSKKGLTLKELLNQTSHHNAKVRRDALLGMKDLFLNHPEELKMHRYAVMEKLRERFNDDDRVVRDTLYQLLKTVILPGCKEDNQEPLIAVMMAYVFNAMTHLAPNVRLMAFKFLDLIVEYYPPSFFLYAEKILQNYEDILWRNQLLLEDKGKLKNALSGLMRCLSLLPSNREHTETSEKDVPILNVLHAYEPYQPRELSNELSAIAKKLNGVLTVLVNCFQDFFPAIHGTLPLDAQSFDCILSILQSTDLAIQFFVHEIQKGEPELELGGQKMTLWCKNIAPLLFKKILGVFPLTAAHLLSDKDGDRNFILNIAITQIFLHLSECMCPPIDLLEKYFSFIEGALLGESCRDMGSRKALREKYISTLVALTPKLLTQVSGHLKPHLSKAFTYTFHNCHPESLMKLACLKAVGEILFSREDTLFPDANTSELLDYWVTWIRMLPELLICLGNRLPSVSKVVLHLLHTLGQRCMVNPVLEQEYDNLQYSLQQFYCIRQDDGNIIYGPFVSLSKDLQELSLCCLYYLPHVDSTLLRSISCCCLYNNLDQSTLFRAIEVLDAVYREGHILISDQISFLITLICHFKVFPENIITSMEIDTDISNRGTFKRVAKEVCSRLSQMGDGSVILRVVENVLLEQMTLKPPLDNAYAMLRILAKLDSRPSRLSDQIIIPLGDFISGYLIDVVRCIPREHRKPIDFASMWHFYNNPCYALFSKSPQLLNLVLSTMRAMVTNSDVNSSTIDAVVSVLLLMHKEAKIQPIVSSLDAWTEMLEKLCSLLFSEQLSIEERNRIKDAFHRLKSATSNLCEET